MDKQNNSFKKQDSKKKTILPFVVHRAPLENHIAYEKKGHWTQKEKLKYVIFLEYFKEKFTSRDKKKRFCRIFKVMSDFIKTRTHNQCRSHHQKMEKERFQVDSIIKNVVSKYHPRVYKELYERYVIQIENLDLEDHQDYNIRKNNQVQFKFSSESNLNIQKLSQKKNLNQSEGQNKQDKRANTQKLTIQPKQQECVDFVFRKTEPIKKQLRMTQQCDQDENYAQIPPKNTYFEFPLHNRFYSDREQSLNFGRLNYPPGPKFNNSKQVPMGFSEYLQSLEMRKMASLDRASFHYNQMQIQLNNVAECQREKSAIIEQQKQQRVSEKYYNFGYSNFGWGYNNFHKQC